jgi:DNA mismatch endonuclease (patch repair protein)
MTDVFTKRQRSKVMRTVKSSGNKSTELRLIEYFKLQGITGWRRNYKLPGRPDFVFPWMRVVIFADGCFWHGHDCRNTKPRQNSDYWNNKRKRNRMRDAQVGQILTDRNWTVIRIWECEIKKGGFEKRVRKFL